MILSPDIHHETAGGLGPQLAAVLTCLIGPNAVQIEKRRVINSLLRVVGTNNRADPKVCKKLLS